MYSCAGPRIVEVADPFPDFTDCPLLRFAACFGCRWTSWSVPVRQHSFSQHSQVRSILGTYRIARYNRLPSRKSSIGAVSGFSGGLAVVTNPPASSRIAIPAATSLIPVNINPLQFQTLPKKLTTPNNPPPTKYQKPPWLYMPDPTSHSPNCACHGPFHPSHPSHRAQQPY